MRILITSDWYTPAVNGVVTSVKNLKRELENRGHEVRILTLSQNLHSWSRDGVTCIGSVDAGLNSYVSLHFRAREMSFLHAFWGLGTTVGPFLLSWCFSHGFSWNHGYRAIALLQGLNFAILLLSFPLSPKNIVPFPSPRVSAGPPPGFRPPV